MMRGPNGILSVFPIRALACVSAVCLAVPLAAAQISGTGSIQGAVSDASGAVLPGAVVTVTEQSTGVQRCVKSDKSGLYNLPSINISTYTLCVSASGFRGCKQPGIVLDVSSSISINVSMLVGAEDQQVEVQAAGIALQTEDTTFKQTTDQRTLTEFAAQWPVDHLADHAGRGCNAQHCPDPGQQGFLQLRLTADRGQTGQSERLPA